MGAAQSPNTLSREMKPPRTSKHNSTGVDSSPNFSQKRDAPSDKPKEGSVSKPKRLNPHRDYLYWKNMPLEEKRRHYTCGSNYVTLDQIPTWREASGSSPDLSPLSAKISLWKGDITTLEIDAIVNAANPSLTGAVGRSYVTVAVHCAAGESLMYECSKLGECDEGDTKLTHGHRLPAKYVLHTVGPMDGIKSVLTSCYKTCLKLVEENQLHSVAFCCVATGGFGFPKKDAAKIAVETVREWLDVNADRVERIIFCVFEKTDYHIYCQLIPHYFSKKYKENKSLPFSHTPAVTKEQQHYLERLEDLMASEDAINVPYLRLFLVGPPFVGKTTTLSRLLGKFENILAAGELGNLPSTLLANCTQVLAFVNDSRAKWLSSDDIDEETVFLIRFLCGAKTEDHAEVPTESVAKIQDFRYQDKVSSGYLEADEPIFKAESAFRQPKVVDKLPQSKFLAIKFQLQKLIKAGWDHPMITNLLSNLLLNITDIGGQPGFLEMLPALSRGPALYLVFFDLSKELDQTYKIPFSRDKTVITPFDAIHTVESTISQILSTICSTHYNSHELPLFKVDKVAGFKQKFEKFQHNPPRAVLIGTHKDKLTDPDEKIKQTDQALKRVTHEFRKIMVVSGSKMRKGASFLPVDNYTGTEESDIAPLRDFMSSIFATHFKHSTLPIRKKWLILNILLRREFCIAKLEDCIELGVILEMDKDETTFCLWYLHNCVGTLMHYTRIGHDEDGWFNNHVICSPQVIFDSISQLMLASLRTLHSEGSVTEYEREELIKKGQFSLESIEKYCSSAEVTKKLENKELIPAKQLVVLLNHANLLSPITHTVQGKVHTTYLMPAILECASDQQMGCPSQPDGNNPEPLYITFDCGYVPTGVFCGLVTRIVSHGPNGIFGLEWRLEEDGVKRNFITFCVDHVHRVTLLSHDKCYEIRVTREDPETSLHDLCAHVLLAVMHNLKTLYGELVPQIAFRCPCCAASAERDIDSLCTLKHGLRVRFLCDRRKTKKPVTLTSNQKVWLGKYVALGNPAELEVLKEHKEHFSFHWTKEGSEKQIQTDGSHTLTFPAVCEKDFGYYICKVKVEGKVILTVYKALYREVTSESGDIQQSTTQATGVATMVVVPGELSVNRTEYLGKLEEFLWDMRAKWDALGIQLGISMGTCEAIDAQCQGMHRVDRCFTALLKEWLSDDPKLDDLLTALRSPVLDRADLANKIEEKIKTGELVLW